MRIGLTLCLLFLALAHPALAANWVIATNGSGSACTEASPCDTFTEAQALAAAGDSILYRAGTYSTISQFIEYDKALNGAAGQRITIKPYPGETVIFDNLDRDNSLAIIAGQGAIVEGFQFRNSHSQGAANPAFDGWSGGVAIWGQYVTFRFNQITGIKQNNAGGNEANIRLQGARDVIIHNNYLGPLEHTAEPSTNGFHLIAFSTGNQTIYRNFFEHTQDSGQGCYYNKHGNLNGSTVLIYENYFKNCSGNSLQSGGQATTIRHNIFDRRSSAMANGGSAITNDATQAGTEPGGGNSLSTTTHTIEYNTFYFNGSIVSQPGGLYTDSTWQRNAIHQTANATGEIYTLRLADYGSDAQIASEGPTFTMVNNCYYNPGNFRISWFGQTSGGAGPAGPGGANYTSLSAFQSATGKDSGSVQTNPTFANVATNDFHTSGSCADMGVYATSNPGTPVLSAADALQTSGGGGSPANTGGNRRRGTLL